MLIEVKTRVSWKIDDKIKKKLETYILDEDVFAEAEYAVMAMLERSKQEGVVEDFEIVSLRQSIVKEIISQYQGENTFIVTLRDTVHQDDGSEKSIKYKVLLWADNISEAMNHAREIASQGYDMQIDGLKEVNYTYLTPSDYEERTQENRVTGDA